MEKSKIEWTDRTYNPIRVKGGGFYCFKVSPACTHCYAETMARRIAAMQHTTEQPYTARLIYPEVELDNKMLESWAKKSKPKKNFVSSMTDIFGEFVPEYFVFEILDAMKAAPKQTFQVLTKRAERSYTLIKDWLRLRGLKRLPKNIWIGFSIENQLWFETRIDWLLKIPCDIKFLSCEPLLGKLKLKRAFHPVHGIKWVIVGGESGNKKTIRPMNPGFAIDIMKQCREYCVAFFFKQHGEYIHNTQISAGQKTLITPRMNVARYPDYKRLGKHLTGALLDGIEYKNFPYYEPLIN